MTAVIRAPGEGERHAAGPAEVVLKATADETGGALFLAEATVPPGSPTPPPHRHERMYDMFWVLEGILTVRVGDDTRDAGPGTFVCVPPGTLHTFANDGDAPVRFLNLSTPGGWERYMRDLAEELETGRPPAEVFARLSERHDVAFER